MKKKNQNNFIVYKYTSPSGKIYIGQTNQGLKKRYYNGQGYKHCSYFYNAICKYGIDNFYKEILKENLSLEEANYWEAYYINFFNSTDKKKGYNISSGGNNRTMSQEAKEKLSKKMKENNPMKNKDIAKKVSEKLRGRLLSEQIKKNISEGHKKKILCIETNIVYNSREEAAKAVGVSPSGVGRAANGEQKTSAGYHWRYL